MELPISTTILQLQCPEIIRFVLGVTKHPDAVYRMPLLWLTQVNGVLVNKHYLLKLKHFIGVDTNIVWQNS